MNQLSIWAYLVACLLLANMPWMFQRFLLVKTTAFKSIWLRLVELLVYSLVALSLGWALEWQLTGDIKDQDWEFFVSVLFMFSIMSFPGLIWYQRHKKTSPPVLE